MHDEIEDIPVRGNYGRAALDIFYLEFNNVNFYVEDQDQENLYEIIFQKLFPEMKIYRIFPLGGKNNVLNHAADPVNQTYSSKNVYIVDKDFDDLLGKTVQDEKIFYLEKYCIENYLVDEDALIAIVIETYPKKKIPEIRMGLKFDDLLPATIQSLQRLFYLFYCVQYFDLGIKNCKSRPEEFCRPDSLWKINEDRLTEYAAKVIVESASKGIQPPITDPFIDLRSELVRKAAPDSVISGKFLLSMLFHYVKSKYSLGSITFESFVFRLAKNSTLSLLEPLSLRLRVFLK